jgi:hypothetical protein
MEPLPATHIADQRRAARRSLEVPIRLRVDGAGIAGVTDNVSGAGVMFFAEEALRVTVEIEEGGRVRTYTGRLVRAQKMSETTTGFAVEFDPA